MTWRTADNDVRLNRDFFYRLNRTGEDIVPKIGGVGGSSILIDLDCPDGAESGLLKAECQATCTREYVYESRSSHDTCHYSEDTGQDAN